MTINRNTWSWEERREFDEVLERVVASSRNGHERVDLFDSLLNDALQAHRVWAHDIDRHARRDGLAAEIRRYQDRNRALMSHLGELLNLPRVQARRIRSDDGDVFYQRELIELFSWEQLAEKRTEALKARGTYTQKVAHYDRLMALRDLAPESATPAEAAEMLGTTIEAWLVGGTLSAV